MGKKDKVINIGKDTTINLENDDIQEYIKKFNELSEHDIENVKIFTLRVNPDMVCIGRLNSEKNVLENCAKLIYKDEKIKVKNEKGKLEEKIKPMALFIPFGFPINYEMYHKIPLSDVSLIEYVGDNAVDFVIKTHEIVRKQYFLEFGERDKNVTII